MNLHSLLVGTQNGSLACFGRTSANLVCGISCAHVLTGTDGYLNTPGEPDIVRIWDSESSKLVECGKTIAVHRSSPPVIDCGIFQYSPSFAQNLIPKLKFLALNNDLFFSPQALLNAKVHAYSGPRNIVLRGKVIQTSYAPWDFIIRNEDGLGFMRGDSGMLWLDENGSAVAIHIAGDTMHQPSTYSYAGNAFQILQHLDVTLYTL